MSDVPSGRHIRPRHRGPAASERARARVAAVLPSARPFSRPVLAAAAVTGIVIGGGTAASLATAEDSPAGATSTDASVGASDGDGSVSDGGPDPSLLAERSAGGDVFDVSRSGARPMPVAAEQVSLDRQGAEAGVSGAATVQAPADPRDIAVVMLADHGWSRSEFGCLDSLWIGETPRPTPRRGRTASPSRCRRRRWRRPGPTGAPTLPPRSSGV